MVHALKKIFDAMASMIVHMIQVMSLIVILIHLPIVSLAFYVIDHKRNQQSNPNPRVIKKNGNYLHYKYRLFGWCSRVT